MSVPVTIDDLFIGVSPRVAAIDHAKNEVGGNAWTLHINMFLRRLCKIKAENNCDFDDIVILGACSLINFHYHQGDVPVVQPANISSIADSVGMSRETVRRRLQAMERRNLVKRFPSGYVISSGLNWASVVELFVV